MANPPVPTVPNFSTPVGRLATDRYDFEAHIEGTNYHHKANQIDLSPSVTINSVSQTNVQQALETLSTLVNPPVVPDATASVKGILRLTNDLGGTALLPKVTGLQGFPLTSIAPSLNQVLAWNGSAWTPTASPNGFAAAGDLTGNNISQQVVSLTGDGSGIINISGNFLQFATGVTPLISQATATTLAGKNTTIRAQSTIANGLSGGKLILQGGTSGTGGLRGAVSLENSTGAGVEYTEVVAGQRILSLVKGSALTSTNTPSGSGDQVIFLANCVTKPGTGGIPVGGLLMYAAGGRLITRQSDGSFVPLGSVANPDPWGEAGAQRYTVRANAQTTSNISANLVTFDLTLPNYADSCLRIVVNLIGKEVGAANATSYTMTMGYITSAGGSPTAMGSVTTSDIRNVGTGSSWIPGFITTNTTTLRIITGAYASTTINWFMVASLYIST